MAQVTMHGTSVLLTYSTSAHPAATLAEMRGYLEAETARVKKQVFPDRSLGLGLRISLAQANELLEHPLLPSSSTFAEKFYAAPPTATIREFAAFLKQRQLFCFTVNAFPVSDAGTARLKEKIYTPPWTDGGRVLATTKIAKVLAGLLGEREAGSLSVPSGTFKPYGDTPEIKRQCAHFITEALLNLVALREATGKTIRLGLEPEPFTTGETTPEFIEYYEQYVLEEARRKLAAGYGMRFAPAEATARDFLGVNLDLAHQACQFEDVVLAMDTLKSAGLRIVGLHVDAALVLPEVPGNHEGFQALKQFDEPRYLHQVIGADAAGRVRLRTADLPQFLQLPPAERQQLAEARVHFHMPLSWGGENGLQSTRECVLPALRKVLAEKLCDTLVLETYTWEVLLKGAGGGAPVADVASGVIGEFEWLKAHLPWS